MRVYDQKITYIVPCVIMAAFLLAVEPGWSATQPNAEQGQEGTTRQPGEDVLTDDQMTIKNDTGHHLLVPNDWPIEHRGSIISPVSVDQYLSMKFGQVKEKFGETDRRLDALERQLKQSDEDRKTLQARLRILEEDERQRTAKEVTHGDTTETR